MDISVPNEDYPFELGQVQPCSIDLRVSNVFWKPNRRQNVLSRLHLNRSAVVDLRRSSLHAVDPLRNWKRLDLKEGQDVLIKPGEVLMGRVFERFTVPSGHAGKIEGRSSYARLGLAIHCTGDFINPGWGGFMPLQLLNCGPYPIRLIPYLSICQLMLVRLSSESESNYGETDRQSKYDNDDGGPSKWWLDDHVKELQTRLAESNVEESIRQEIIDTVKPESPEIIERFEGFLDSRKVREIHDAEGLLTAFSKREDSRRWLDRGMIGLPGVIFALVCGALFAGFQIWHVVLYVGLVVSFVPAIRSYFRRDAGYLGTSEKEQLNRPAGQTS